MRNYLLILLPILLITACKPKTPGPFDEGNKWYAIYGDAKLPIIIGDTLYRYELDTSVTHKMRDDHDYYEYIMEAMKLKEKIRFTYTDSAISFVKYPSDTLTTFDTTTLEYELVYIDSIPLLKYNGEYLVPWDRSKNFGTAKHKSLKDFTSLMELGGYRIGQKIDESKWVKTGEKINYLNGLAIGKYKNIYNKDLEADAYDGYIVAVSQDDITESEAEELTKLYKYHEKDTMEVDKDPGYFEKRLSGQSKNGTYMSIYKTKELRYYGYLISRSEYSTYLRNSDFLDLLGVLDHVRKEKK